MARGDWEPNEVDEPWLPDFDVRAAVARLPPESVDFEDFTWDNSLHGSDRIIKIRDIIHELRKGKTTAVTESLSELRCLTCDEGTTSVYGASVVPSLIRLAANRKAPQREGALQLVGDLARMDFSRHESRSELLRTMGAQPRYDSWGYLENLAVEAVRMMVRRDIGPLLTLLSDDEPQVRSRASYVMAAALPASPEITDAVKARLAVERNSGVQMTLVVSIAQHERERDSILEAQMWTRTLWSEPTSAFGIRLGAVIAWLGLTPEDMPPELRSLVTAMPMPLVYSLLRELPWIWWLSSQAGELEEFWRNLIKDGVLGY